MTEDTANNWFTWPDGVFSYECRGCGACCKGLGIGVDAVAGELDRLAEAYPEIEAFARLRGSTWTAFNPRDRCWFLDDDGWCRVEREHGRDTKPASCRLFPFNRVFWVGDCRVIDFNAVICPLRAAPTESDAGQVGSSGRVAHADVVAEIDAVRDPGVVGTRLELHGLSPSAWASHERAVARRAFELAPSCAAGTSTDGRRGLRELCAAMVPEALAEVVAPIDAAEAGLTACLDGLPELPSEATLRHALYATPSLRFNELFGRRASALTHPVLFALLPGMWWAWLHLLGEGERLATRPLTLQEVTSVWGEVAPLGALLALWSTPVWLPVGEHPVPEGPARGAVTAFAKALTSGGRPRALGEAAEPLVRAHTVRERVARAHAAAGLLARLEVGAAREASATSRASAKPISRTKRRKRRR